MSVGELFFHGKQQIEVAHYIIRLSQYRMFAVDHREWSRALFAKMHDRFRLELTQGLNQEIIIIDISEKQVNSFLADLVPFAQPLLNGSNGSQGLNAKLLVPMTTD